MFAAHRGPGLGSLGQCGERWVVLLPLLPLCQIYSRCQHHTYRQQFHGQCGRRREKAKKARVQRNLTKVYICYERMEATLTEALTRAGTQTRQPVSKIETALLPLSAVIYIPNEKWDKR